MPEVSRIPQELVREGERMANVCNACRYCEGYCATFPALERRLSFPEADLGYLANLCHNCGACLYSCQYAPPHEFQLNFPRMLAQLRGATYRKYAWPSALAGAFERNGLVTSVVTMVCLAAVFVAMIAGRGSTAVFSARSDGEGAFYALIPNHIMSLSFGLVGLFDVVALAVAVTRFWRDLGESIGSFFAPRAWAGALSDALRLRYLDGGGHGCTYPNDEFTSVRRIFHHFTFYGFMLCFASTSVAAGYHYLLHWEAPYAILSLPVLLGIAGGAGLVVGASGLFYLKCVRDPALAAEDQTGMDVGFLVLLLVVATTGLLLLALRESAAMGVLLALHLGAVLAFFVMIPYGKFVHAVYRLVALVHFHRESSRSTHAG